MSNETLKTGEEEEVITDGSLPENYTEELLARIEQDTPHYPEDNEGNEQPPILDAEDYLGEAASRFGERDLQVSFEPTLMGRFDGKRLYHLEAYGQKRDVTEMMEKADPVEKANFERRLEELALDGQSFDFNEETGEVIVHIVIGENYYTLAFSGRSAEGGESTPFAIEDGEALPPRQEEVPYSPVAVEVLNLNPVLGSERGVDDPVAREETVASQPVFDARRASEGEEMIASEKPEVRERAPMPEPAVEPEMKLESRPISEPAELTTDNGSQDIGLAIERAPQKAEPLPDPTSEPKRQPESTAPLQTEDDFEGISLIIERPTTGGSVEAATEVVSMPAHEHKDGVLLTEAGDLVSVTHRNIATLPELAVDIHPSSESEYGIVEPFLEPSERPEQSIIENNLDGISLAIETPLEDKVSREEGGTQKSATEIISVSVPEEETYSLIHQAEEHSIPVETEMEEPRIEMIEAEEDSRDVGGEYMAKKSTLREAAEIRTAPQGAAENQETGELLDILPEADAIEPKEAIWELTEVADKEPVASSDPEIIEFSRSKPEVASITNEAEEMEMMGIMGIEEIPEIPRPETTPVEVSPLGLRRETRPTKENSTIQKKVGLFDAARKPISRRGRAGSMNNEVYYSVSMQQKTEASPNRMTATNPLASEQPSSHLKFANLAKNSAARFRILESSINNFGLFKPTIIASDEEVKNDTINIHKPEFELAV